jgi:hypothetical protein
MPQPQMQPAPVLPHKKPKRFGWPTLIIATVVALGVGGMAGGGDGTATTAAPTATVTATGTLEGESTPTASKSASRAPVTKFKKAKKAKKTPEPEPKRVVDPANRVSKRQYAKIMKNPDRYSADRIIVYGEVTQFDSATGDSHFLADTAYRNTTSYGYFAGKNTALNGSTQKLDDLVEGDVFRASVTVTGSHDYDTQIGGRTSVAQFEVNSIKVIG